MIGCGYYHTACLTQDGEVYAFGRNDYGQLGGPCAESLSPNAIQRTL